MPGRPMTHARHMIVTALLAFALLPGCAAEERASDAVHIDTVAEGLEHPWGLAFLPDGRSW